MNRPNILFFFTDDQRFDTIRALGNKAIQTPNLDRLVDRGTAFTHAHIPCGTSGAVCMPSRAMLHSGRTLFHIQDAGQSIPADHTLIGEHLRANGYRTFGTGKWHNGTDAYARSFTDGAEIMFGGMDDHWNVSAHHFDPSGAYDSRIRRCRDAFTSNQTQERICDHVTPGKHSSELFAEATIDFLRAYDTQAPWFVYVSFMAPHDPRTMPQEFLDLYDPETIALPPNFSGGHPFDNGALRIRDEQLEAWPREAYKVRRHIAEYYAMITHLDHQVGQVLGAVEARGELDNTLVVFAGDNGLAVGQHGLMGKQSCYDHSVRVPLLFAGPGIPEGEQRDSFVYLFDIFPTICELLEIDTPDSVEGNSLLHALRDHDSIRDTLYFAYVNCQRAVRHGRHKLIEYVVDGRRTTQLFDLQADPWERTNLADAPAHQDTLAHLRQLLEQQRDAWDDTDPRWGEPFWQGYR